MAIPGTVPVTAPVAPSATGDVYPSHIETYGQGGYRSVADSTERDAITAERRSEGMLVRTLDTGETYVLEADLTTWTIWNNGVDPTDVMLKSVYDPNDDGIVTNSDQLEGQNGAYYLARANHTGTQAQSTIVDLVTDLSNKVETSLIGAANGIVPLNASTLIDNAYLNFALPLDPVIAWDVVTNTPSISDAGGAAGEVYIVYGSANPTARDLGSGSIDWYDGDVVVYDSGTSAFVRIAAYTLGVSQVTTALGVQTGPVTLDDTSYFDPSTDRNYVTDDQEAAISGANSPSASNVFATMDDLTGLIVVGNGVFMPELYANGETLGTGTLRTLTSLGYTNGSAGAIWTRVNSAYTIDVTTMDIDWIAWQEAMLAMEQNGYNGMFCIGGRGYTPYTTITLPVNQGAVVANRRSQWFIYNFNGSTFVNTTGNDFPIFERMPANQAAAGGSMLDYSFIFERAKFFGNNTTSEDDCFIRLGATKCSRFSDIEGEAMGMLIDAQFCLQVDFKNIKITKHKTYGIAARSGSWSGAGADNSQSNNATFDHVRVFNGAGLTATAGIYLNCNRNINIANSQFEGNPGSVYQIFYDQQFPSGSFAGTVKNCLTVTNSDWESGGASRAGIRIRGGNLQAKIDTFNIQTSDVDMPVFIESDSSATSAGNDIRVSNHSTYTTGWKFRNIINSPYETSWIGDNVDLVNNASLTNASNWASDFGGVVPSSGKTRYYPIL